MRKGTKKRAVARSARGGKPPQAPTLARDIAGDVLTYIREGLERPLTEAVKNYNPPNSNPPTSAPTPPTNAPYKTRLGNIYSSAGALLSSLQAFDNYLHPIPTDSGAQAAANAPSSLDELLGCIEYLLDRSYNEVEKLRSRF